MGIGRTMIKSELGFFAFFAVSFWPFPQKFCHSAEVNWRVFKFAGIADALMPLAFISHFNLSRGYILLLPTENSKKGRRRWVRR
jgi:hypothetical protein